VFSQPDQQWTGLDLQVDLKVCNRGVALRIGEVAEQTRTTTTAIRYYESIGLLKPAQRSDAGYRRYTQRTVEELHFIRKAQAIGLSLEEVREILQIARSGNRPCERVKAILERHLQAIDERVKELTRFRKQLAMHLEQWRREGSAPTGSAVCGWIQALDETTITHAAKPTSRQRTNGSTAAGKRNKEKE
jgi:MerR family transcriptional regulator, copper efflux regulator